MTDLSESHERQLRQPDQDERDEEWAKFLVAGQSDDCLRGHFEDTGKRIREGSSGSDQNFDIIHNRVLREELGRRGIIFEIISPED